MKIDEASGNSDSFEYHHDNAEERIITTNNDELRRRCHNNNQNSSFISVDFDDILPYIGSFGRYQMTLYVLLCIPATLPAAFLAFNQVFLSATPNHWCHIPSLADLNISEVQKKSLSIPLLSPNSHDDQRYSQCLQYDVNFTQLIVEGTLKSNKTWPVSKCQQGWMYDRTEYKSTLVTEMNIVCDRSWWIKTSTSLFYVGSLFGNVIFGYVADTYGRRTSFFILVFIEVTLSIITSFSPNYIVYTVLRTINGFTFPALFQIPFILSQEIMGPSHRTFAGMMMCMFFAFALILLSFLSYMFNTWYHLALVTSVPFVMLFSYWWFLPESPRWLLSFGRIDEAELIVQKIAKWNQKKISQNFIRKIMAQKQDSLQKPQRCDTANKERSTIFNVLVDNDEDDDDTSCKSSEVEDSMLDLIMRYPITRRNFFLITFNWLANALVYNGLSFYSANMNVSSHLGFFISAVVEIPSYIIGIYIMEKWGRRWILFVTMMTGGISCICCMFVPLDASPWFTVTLAMIGKFQIAISFAVIYVYAGELMPTVVRSEAMGISSFIAGIGLLIFPYINGLSSYSHYVPLVIMGTLSVMGGIVALFLPETLWIHLPNTLAEGEAIGNHFKMCSCPQREEDHDDDNEDSVKVEQFGCRFEMQNFKTVKSAN